MHELEQVTTLAGEDLTSFAFTGDRADIWHRLGQAFGADGADMTADEALRAANMDRELSVREMPAPDGAEWSIPQPSALVLAGKAGITPAGDLFEIPAKVVGIAGKGGADAHRHFTMRDRFLIAEEAIHASNGAAVWSTAGLLRGATQGFAAMRCPDIIIDPAGIADIIASYMTVSWSFDGSRATELSASEVRAVCANTLALADRLGVGVIKVKHTSHTAKDRMALAAQHWATAQDRAAAMKLQAERLMAVRDGRKVLSALVETWDPAPAPDASKRARTMHDKRRELVEVLWHAPTNDCLENDGWRAWNTFAEFLDWHQDVRCAEGESEGDRRLGNQFDGIHDALKADAAALILSGDLVTA